MKLLTLYLATRDVGTSGTSSVLVASSMSLDDGARRSCRAVPVVLAVLAVLVAG